MRDATRFSTLVGLLLVMLACYVYVAQQPLLAPLQNWTFDLYQSLRPRVTKAEDLPARVVIVDIDEKALSQYGQWPWSRTVLAKLTQSLKAYGVLVVGFDVVFAEADRTSPKMLARELPPKAQATLAGLPDHDDAFARAIAENGRVVLGQVGEFKPVEAERLKPKARFAARQTSFDAPKLEALLHRYPGAVLNLPVLEQAAAGAGLFSTIPDGDGVYRKVALLERIGADAATAQTYPSLSLEMIRIALGGADSVFAMIDGQGIRAIRMKTAGGQIFDIPTDSMGRVWVHFAKYVTGKPPLYVSAADVMAQRLPPASLSGALALVGTSAVGLKDIRATPISGQMPGVEIHAQVMETILANAHLRREVSTFWKIPLTAYYLSLTQMELLSILIGGLLMVVLVPRLPAWLVFLVGAGEIGGLVALGWYHYLHDHILVDYTYPSLAIFTVFFVLTYLNYMREEAQKKQIRSAFGHYVSPALLEQLAADPSRLVLGGETRTLTLLFSDIRGFTTISERFNAQELTRFINRYLTPMTNVIMEQGGTVDKYMGDAIMAFWNAPLDDAEHARHACLAALAMQQAVKALGATLRQEAEKSAQADENRRSYVPIAIGIGINTGDCCVGNMGSDQRFDYSALGDTVNLASRLEGQSKTYGVDIVLGENTAQAVAEEFAILELDLIQVKGKTLPVRIYTLLGNAQLRDDALFKEVKSAMQRLLEAYRAQDWDGAAEAAEQIASLYLPLKELARLYLFRIRHYRVNPPPPGWSGTYIAESK